jgi:hypothetical protein
LRAGACPPTSGYPREHRFFRCKIGCNRLARIKAMDQQSVGIANSYWQSSGLQTHQSSKGITCWATLQSGVVDNDARLKRHSRVERPARDIRPCHQ